MNNNNKYIVEVSKRPVETVQELENAWEEELNQQEQTLLGEFGLNQDEVYEAELVETGRTDLESNLVHQPISTNKQKPFFLIKIELSNFYLTDSSALGSFLWFHNQVKELTLNKVENAKELLNDLKQGELRLVDDYWGLETESALILKKELVEGLESCIQTYERGEEVISGFKE